MPQKENPQRRVAPLPDSEGLAQRPLAHRTIVSGGDEGRHVQKLLFAAQRREALGMRVATDVTPAALKLPELIFDSASNSPRA